MVIEDNTFLSRSFFISLLPMICQCLLSVMQEIVASGVEGKALDVGCGPGNGSL